jgi:hypothetical protein
MAVKTYPRLTCKKCSKPHFSVLGCQLAADLRGALTGQMSRAVGDPEATAEAWKWYDAELASHGIKTDHYGEHLRVLEQMHTNKPAVHPTEKIAQKVDTSGHSAPEKVSTGPKVSTKSVQKPAKVSKVSKKVDTSEKSVQESVHRCVECGHSWPARKKPPLRCANKACRSRKWRG